MDGRIVRIVVSWFKLSRAVNMTPDASGRKAMAVVACSLEFGVNVLRRAQVVDTTRHIR